MMIATDIDAEKVDTVEVIEMAAELLSEAGDLTGTSVIDFVEYMIDRWPNKAAGSAS